jgi:sugar lactone lactonase YvrE
MIKRLPNLFLPLFFCFIVTLSTSIIVSAQHSVSTLCGTSVQGSPLSGPDGICLSPDGNILYVCDYTAHKIKKVVIASGAVSTLAGTGTGGYTDGALLSAKFFYPTGIRVSSDGNFLFIADNGNCLIRKIDIANGLVSTIAGVYNAFSYSDNANGMLAQFNQPIDLALSGDSILYVSDSENQIIRKINLVTTAVTTIAGTPTVYGNIDSTGMNARFRYPTGLCLSNNGLTLFVADASNHKIRKINLSNTAVTTLAGTGYQGSADNAVGTNASFYSPQGVTVLSNDSLLYVADTYNNLIRAINLNTTCVSTIAGSTSTSSNHFTDNSDGLLAKFYHPIKVILSLNSGKLYISDQENFRIRIMNTDVSIPTVVHEIHNSINASVFPNPAQHVANVALTGLNTSSVEYCIVTPSGDIVSPAKNIFVTRVDQTFPLSLNNLANGIYYVVLKADHEKYFLKLMVLN